MFTQDDLIDLLMEDLQGRPVMPIKPAGDAAGSPGREDFRAAGLRGKRRQDPPSTPPKRPWTDGLPKGRPFLSEHEIKRMLTPGVQVLRIPRGAILSPLAQDWLALKGIRILAE